MLVPQTYFSVYMLRVTLEVKIKLGLPGFTCITNALRLYPYNIEK